MNLKWLCLIFGITPSACSRILHYILRLAVKRLRHHPLARVKFPNEEEMQQYADMIRHREPSVTDVIGFMDGVSFTTECTDERVEQNAYYCGYDCDTMVNNVFIFGPDGKIFRDQGFPRSGEASGILVGPIPERSAWRLHPAVRDNLLRLSNVYTSLRQASEWGIRGMQGTFPRCKKRLPSDRVKRRLVIESIIFINNFRTHIVGLNQISTVFNPEYEQVINLDGYDRIRQYYLQPGDYETDDDDDLD